VIEEPVRFVDERIGAASLLRKTLRYVFPDHWSFMLGEIALYCFVVLVGTGIFMAFHYTPSDAETVYRGTYEPLQGVAMTEAYHSVVRLSLDVPAGLLMRQTHHWAANVFIAAILLHLVRILFTGAFRKPREINYLVGVTMLGLAVFEGFAGYSLIDDLLSGMGLAIAYSVALSIPFVGADVATLVWAGEYPGATVFWDRLFAMHILIVPVLLAGLISLHLLMITRQHHAQFPGPRRTESNVVGTPLWPGYALRSLGLMSFTAGLLFLLGGLVQINPIWLWGPYETYLSTNGAQPDWYLAWLIGGLRIMPPLELQVADYTVVPTPFWGGLLFPVVAFAVLYAWPLIDRRFSRRGERHELLDRPRDNPRRSAALAAFLSWVAIPFIAGAADRVFYRLGISYEAQIWFFRILAVVGPVLVWIVARRVFQELHDEDVHPLRGWTGRVVRRRADGGFETLASSDGRREHVPSAEQHVARER
jgi:ubiquinol-cytochrome c reductase cytochrome b subunit